MKILVTGGTGFIGRPLCAELLAAGYQVTVLSRNPQRVAARCGPQVRAFGSLDEWAPHEHFDAVINLAGAPIIDRPWSVARRQVLRDSRVLLTRQLVGAMARAEARPAVLLSGSAIGIYGDSGALKVDEAAQPATDFAARLCADWETAALAAADLGVRACLLRTGLVLDPSGGLLGRMLPAFRLGLGARLGDGRQWMSWIALPDYMAAILALLHNPVASGPFNLTSPEPVTNARFTALLAKSVRRPAFMVAPGFLLKPLLGERAPLLLGGQRVLPKRLLELRYSFRHAGLDDALSALLGR